MPFQLTRRGFLASTAATSLTLLHPFSARAQAGQAHLRLMETTDLHVHVFPYDYYSDKPVDTVGLSRTASIIKDIRAEATNSLLLDNGDFLQGNPMGDYIAYERGMKEGDEHPVITAMNTVGIEASTLGNHEFNYGLDFLMKSLAKAGYPVVCANIAKTKGATPTEDETLLPPYTILTRTITDGAGEAHPIKIGIIGFVPPQVMNWDRKHLEGNVEARDIVEAARAYVPEMIEKGTDVIIALSHSGIGSANESDMMENASVPLATVEGIDCIMTGHSHLVFPSSTYADFAAVDAEAGTIHGKPAAMAGFWGSHLGLIDLMLERDGASPATPPRRAPFPSATKTAPSPRWSRMIKPCSTACARSMKTPSPTSAAPLAKPPRRCTATSPSWPMILRCRSCPTPKSGISSK